MTTGNADAASVTPPAGASGASSNSSETPPVKDTVAYETHKKLLDEKKKQGERLAVLEAAEAERGRKELEAKGEYQKIIEAERAEKDKALKVAAELQSKFADGKKFSAFRKALGSDIDEKYFGLVPLESVLVDPETGEVNQTTAATAAETFKKSYPEILKAKNAPGLPNATPNGAGPVGTIARSEWLKLTSKEMLKYKPDQIIS